MSSISNFSNKSSSVIEYSNNTNNTNDSNCIDHLCSSDKITVKKIHQQHLTNKTLLGYDDVNEEVYKKYKNNNLCSMKPTKHIEPEDYFSLNTVFCDEVSHKVQNQIRLSNVSLTKQIEYIEPEDYFNSNIVFYEEVSHEVQNQYRLSNASLTKQIEHKASKDNCKPVIELTPKFDPNTTKNLNCEETRNNTIQNKEFLVKPNVDSSANLKNMKNSKIINASLSLPVYNDKKLPNSNQSRKSKENVINKNEFKSNFNNTKLIIREDCGIKYKNKNIKNNDVIFNNFDNMNNYINNSKDKELFHPDNYTTNHLIISNSNNNNNNCKKISRKGCCVIF